MGLIRYLKARKQKKIEKKRQQSKTKRILKTIGGTILYILLIIGLIWGLPKALSSYLNTQYPMAAITSGSMWPELKKGDLIFIRGIDPQTVEIGDIIVYTNEKNAFTIHRVVELKDETLITKGDANNIKDKPIKYEDIVGRLYQIGGKNARIPRLGFISTSFSKFANPQSK